MLDVHDFRNCKCEEIANYLFKGKENQLEVTI
jgi:hypothetical protein